MIFLICLFNFMSNYIIFIFTLYNIKFIISLFYIIYLYINKIYLIYKSADDKDAEKGVYDI